VSFLSCFLDLGGIWILHIMFQILNIMV
jgi:hypothetical protein